MICYVMLRDERKIDSVTHYCEKTFAVKALSTEHALKKAMNHLWRTFQIQDVSEASATTEQPHKVRVSEYPLVRINTQGTMTGTVYTRHYTD